MLQLPPLSEEDFDAWLGNPVTKRLHGFLIAGLEEAKQNFIDGHLLMDNHWGSAMKQAIVIGRCEMAQTILDLEHRHLENLE